jgi:hypothetical protein
MCFFGEMNVYLCCGLQGQAMDAPKGEVLMKQTPKSKTAPQKKRIAKNWEREVSEEEISSLSEFFKVLEKLKEDEKLKIPISSSLYYRGHSDSKYKLKPSLFREKDGSYKEREHSIFERTLIENPEYFYEDKSTFEKLVRMQHFGLPTRLLDITENPLAALYFACKEQSKKNGEVLIFSIDGRLMNYDGDDIVMILSNLCKLMPSEKKLEMNEKNEKKLIREIKKEDITFCENEIKKEINKIVPVRAAKSNERIQAQDGLFFLFGAEPNYSDLSSFLKKRIKIAFNKKDYILNQLEKVNISAKTLLPGLEGTAEFFKRKHEKKQKKK